MEQSQEFYTLKGYQMNHDVELTSAMEDYLEMIYRILLDNAVARVSDLSARLHVTAPSASKMVQQLKEAGFVSAEKYGYLTLTKRGADTGEYLYRRHCTINRFLCKLNGTEDETEQAEKIEHFLTTTTVENLARLTECMDNPGYTYR